MFGVFGSKPVISDLDQQFQHDTYAWLLSHFGGPHFFKGKTLVLPTRDYFPAKVDSLDGAVSETFLTVKKYAGMSDWECVLQRQDEDVEARVAPTVVVKNAPTNPLGTFSATNKTNAVITYNPKLAKEPLHLVATFAHELAHYLTATAPEPPPGGWDNWEFATDIAATFLGFGVFMANSAFSFRQYTDLNSQGWRWSRSGYLTEAEHVYALSLFLHLQKRSLTEVKPYLKSNLWSLIKKAYKQAEQSGIIDDLFKVQYKSANS